MPETSKTVRAQTRISRKSTADPKFHYVAVEKESRRHESQIDRYMDMINPITGDELYEEIKNDRTIASSRGMHVLRCPKEAWDAYQKIIAAEAEERAEAKAAEDGFDVKQSSTPIRLGDAT